MRILRMTIRAALIGVITGLCAGGASAAQQAPFTPPKRTGPASVLDYVSGSQRIHAMPTIQLARRIAAARTSSSSDLNYNGGPVMTTATIYLIFWEPAKMQDGSPTQLFTSLYIARQNSLLANYVRHGIDNNNTQYYETVGGRTVYIANEGANGGSVIDNNPFPAKGCTDNYNSVTQKNCLSDAQLQAEIQKVITYKNWTGGLNHIFFIFTPFNMGSCMGSNSSGGCAYTDYCAYHSSYGSGPVIYADEPYGDANVCWDGGPAPSGNVPSDSTSSTSSHELSEAITDPEGNAWINNASGSEIGDLCAYNFGTSSWDNAQANEMWNGNFFRIQQEYDNHVSGCVQVGP